MYGPQHVPPATAHADERKDPHPVFGSYMGGKVAQAFQREDVRDKVIPAYMGLIKQCDDQLGVLLDHLAEADATRGTTCDALVEAIDLAPTFVEAAGGEVADHILEGRSLAPWLRGETPDWRSYVISEYDFSGTPHCKILDLAPRDCRLFMIFDGRFKMMHAEGGFRPMLFDLHSDPEEFFDLAKGGAHQAEIDRLYGSLAEWGRRMSQRVTRSDAQMVQGRGRSMRRGILPFMVDGSEVPEEMTVHYRGPAGQRYTEE